jgi:DNA-binding NarL/FixJ family response regulator
MPIFIIDDHPLMREAISLLLRRLSIQATVVELDRLAAVPAAVAQHGAPELICLDLKLPDAQGVSGIIELKQQFPATPLVVISAAPAEEFEDLAIENGADAYIQKSAGATEIANVLRVFLSDDLEPMAPAQKLSKRQKQLLVMLDKGQSNHREGASLAPVPAPEREEPVAGQPPCPHPGPALVQVRGQIFGTSSPRKFLD